MNVLVVGHACGVGKGSEPGNTWNLAWHLSHEHRVWVIAYPENRADIEAYVAEHPNPNLRFVWLNSKRAALFWNPRRGQRGIRLHYLFWLQDAFRAAAALAREIPFDVCHQISLSTVSAPPSLWRLPVPFVWGPVGGGQRTPPGFRRYFGKAWPAEALRGLRLSWLPRLPALRRAVNAAAAVLATNRETAALLAEAGATRVRLFLDCGLPAEMLRLRTRTASRSRELRFLWAGRFEAMKGLPLAFEALACAPELPVTLLVAGDGALREQWRQMSRSLGVDRRVVFLGNVPYSEMPRLFDESDAFVFTSLRDSFGSVVLEAMAHELPVIALDHHGVGTFVPPNASIKVPVVSPAATVRDLTAAIRTLAGNPDLRRRMGSAARAFAETQTWPRRAAEIGKIYEEVCVAHRAV